MLLRQLRGAAGVPGGDRIADRVVLLVHGRIAADGSPREVLTPERLSAAYEVPIDVEAVADGLRIRPRRIRRQPAVSRAA